MRRTSALLAVVGSFAMARFAPTSMANPSPSTNGGNGAGKSGQCTDPKRRPAHSCKSQGGPSNQR